MKILFCMASGQTAANLNCLKDIAPEKVVVAITEGMSSQGNNLFDQIKAAGYKAERLDITQESSLRALNKQFEAWLEQHIDDDIEVNVTGGTKLMSIAAYELFNSYGFRCFYQNLEPNQIIWLDDESVIADVGHSIGLERYLKGYQFEIIKKVNLAEIPKAHKLYAEILYAELCKAGRYAEIAALISKLNAHAAKPKIDSLNHFSLSHEEQAFLEHLSRETDVFSLNHKTIEWQTEADRVLIAGGWLEVLTADLLRGSDMRDIHLSVEIGKSTQRKKSKTFQEIDVMAMKQQKLVIIECKTVNWKTASTASEAIYKLSALSDIGGLNTQSIFVSLYDLKDAAKTRAAEHDIKVIAGQSAIIDLRNQLLGAD